MKQNNAESLTQQDFLRLKQNPQPYARAAIARKLGQYFEGGKSDSSRYQIATDIALHLQKDTHNHVRLTLAQGVCRSATAPKKLIVLLANDGADEVAVPVLRESPLLDEKELTNLLKNMENPVRLVAVAERRFLSVGLSHLVAEKGYEQVAVALLDNTSAIIDNATHLKLATLHAGSSRVLQKMMQRIPMPEAAIAQMQSASRASAQENKPKKPAAMSSFSSISPQELKNHALTMMLLGESPGAEECMILASQFHKQGKINAPLMMLALCLGQLGLFFAFLADSTGQSYAKVESDSATQPEKMRMLLLKSGISPSLLPLLEWVYKGATQRLEQGLKPGHKQLTKLMAIHLHEGARKGVNFAATVGAPVAKVLDELL